MFGDYENFLTFIGLIFVSGFLLSIIKEVFRGIRLYLLPTFVPPDFKKYGEWVVITGGSAGIGKCTAQQLAKFGLNLVLVSNESEELKMTAEDIQAEFGVKCCDVMADLTGGKKAYDSLWAKIQDKDVGIFINCAGIDGKSPCLFLEETERNIQIMMALNMNVVVDTTYRLCNYYLKKKKGVIVNISSLSSFFPTPYYATYSACKKFVDDFSKAVMTELSGTNVTLQSLTPFFVNTRMLSDKPYLMTLGPFVPSTETFCQSWAKSIGISNTCSGFWLHEVLAYCTRFCPSFILNLSMGKIYSNAEKFRKEVRNETNAEIN
ncbi:inactive hydroxysteroid dehydrogenase-like protein 1 [Centruroides sculpturatus]|uniref:inactive hydroxysteroid dehydrogenase-like protein 1 n=1 Tax=Centruroides sculpturatus TaxID=218467 RepID=UPI000C6EE89C|nr:inactive hydroxysteroid dehydrogenase-like protein 1 [Centruroides sculpturatus]